MQSIPDQKYRLHLINSTIDETTRAAEHIEDNYIMNDVQSSSLFSLTDDGLQYYSIDPSDYSFAPPTLTPAPCGPAVMDSSTILSMITTILSTVSATTQDTQKALMEQLGKVANQVPDSKSSNTQHLQNLEGIFYPSINYSTSCMSSDGRLNLISTHRNFRKTLANLPDTDKPSMSDEMALKHALLLFNDQGSNDATLNDYRAKGCPPITTVDSFLTAHHFMRIMMCGFFGLHLREPLQHLMCELIDIHRRYSIPYAKLVTVFDAKMSSLRTNRHDGDKDP